MTEPETPNWQQIAADLVIALELQREAAAITHVHRPSPLSVKESRKVDALHERVATYQRAALIALGSMRER
ncbi:MAG TPA: hypothetical protein VGN07_17485 [Steroidobacteraceae bacterium]